jgi:acetoin utilization deacetylase AcuC-like enzyme
MRIRLCLSIQVIPLMILHKNLLTSFIIVHKRHSRLFLHRNSSNLIESFTHHPDVTLQYQPYDSSKPYFPIYYNDVYEVNLPKGHRFPMKKYRQVRDIVQKKLTSNSPITQFHVAPLVTWDDLIITHDPSYVERFLSGATTDAELRAMGFPWSLSGVRRALSSSGGTVAAACSVCEAMQIQKLQDCNYPIWGGHLAGGTHHAFYDRGEGFCIFSDIAVAANVVRRDYPFIQRILIIDLDVHQGNGNAVLFQGREDVITFSMHCQGNYFSQKEKSDLDVELPVGCSDETYLATLRHWLKQIEKHGGNFDLAFYQAGVDILDCDRLGRMNLTTKGVSERNKFVFEFCHRNSIPLIITMGGGYPQSNDWTPVLQAHAGVYLEAHQYLMNIMEGR